MDPRPWRVPSTKKVPEAKPTELETPSAIDEGEMMVELLVSMTERVPELEMLPVDPSTKKRILLPLAAPTKREEET